MKKFRTIVFDLGGVLIPVGFPVLALLEVTFNLVHEWAHDVFPKDLVGFFHHMIFIVVLGLEAAAEFVLSIILVIGLMPVQEEHLVEAFRSAAGHQGGGAATG